MVALEAYHQQVRDAIISRNGTPLLNGSVEHASIITQEAFNRAQQSVRILSTRLDPGCYAQPGVLDAAKVFLADPDHRAEILVETPLWDPTGNFPWEKHPLFAVLKDCGKQLHVRSVPKDLVDRYAFNFLLLDDYGFRFEADRRKSAAVAAFLPATDERAQVKNLSDIFSRLWGGSEPLKVA